MITIFVGTGDCDDIYSFQPRCDAFYRMSSAESQRLEWLVSIYNERISVIFDN